MKEIVCDGNKCTNLIASPFKLCDDCVAKMERDIQAVMEPESSVQSGCFAIIGNPLKDALQSVKKTTRLQHAAYKEYGEEKSRRESFIGNWPNPQRPQEVQALAKYGFFYAGNSDLVRCHQCGIGLKDWSEEDNPLREHIRYSPDCQFLQNILVSSHASQAKLAIMLFRDFVYGHPQAESPDDTTTDKAETREQADVAQQRVKKHINAQYITSLSRTTLSLTAVYKEFTSTEVRLRSFNTGWPHLSQVLNVDLLAKNGFFYTGRDDLVGCFQCGIALSDWSKDDDPVLKHVRYSPDCLFLVECIPADLLVSLKASCLPAYTDCNTDSDGNQHSACTDISDATSSNQPTLLDFNTVEQRISSFVNWPKHMTQTPEELARAGFFYTGAEDNVCCFACKKVLKKWNPGETPWYEHARWSTTCPHILQTLGEDFVRAVKLLDELTPKEHGNVALGSTEEITTTTKETPCVENNEEDISALKEENTILKRRMTCKLCLVDRVKILFLPCGHLWVCQLCAKDLEKCPECHKPINDTVNVKFEPNQ